MICVFLFVMELLPKHIRVNKIRYPESTSNMLIYLSYDAYSSRTGRSDHATLARSSSLSLSLSPSQATYSGLAEAPDVILHLYTINQSLR